MSLAINEIHHGDCLDLMKQIPDKSIDLTVTSPPYDNLRTYNGYTFDFEGIANELYRITKDGGVVVWVVGDATIKGSETGTSFRQALYFKEIGFNLHDTMIYHKSNYAPIYPTLRRYANTFEYMFILSIGMPNIFHAIQQEKSVVGYKNRKCAFRQRDGSLIRKTISCNRETKDAENVWTICPMKSKGAGDHPAVFPEQLAGDHILSWSNPGDIVLDPMCGSGTTCKMAVKHGRKFIGIDCSAEYVEIARRRVDEERKKPEQMEIAA